MATKVADLFATLGLRMDEGAWSRADKMIGNLKKGIAAYLSIKGIQALGGVVSDVVELGSKFSDASQKTGVSAEKLQEWGYAAGLAGSNVDEVIQSLGKLNKGLGEAARNGKGPAADGLRALGISMSDPAVKAGDLDAVLLKVADKFKAMPDGPKKVAAAMDLFGKSGANMIPTLNQGADGIAKLKQEARDLGVVIDKDTIGALDNLGDDVDRAKAGWQGFKNQMVAAIVPILADLLPGLIALMKRIGAWAKEHKLEIAAVFHAVVVTIGTVIDIVIEVVKFLAAVIAGIAKGFIWLGETLVSVARKIVAAFSGAWKWIVDKAKWLWNGLKSVGRGIVDGFVAVGQAIRDAFLAAFEWIANLPVIKQIIDVVNKIRDAGDIFNDNAQGDFETAKATAEQSGQAFPLNRREWTEQKNARIRAAQTGKNADGTPFVPPNVPSVPAKTQSATVVDARTSMVVNAAPGMDELKLANLAGTVLEDKMANVFRQVANATGGRVP